MNGVLNAVRVCDDLMEENILIGHGAGSLPTGSAVVADIVEIARDILLESKLRVPPHSFQKFLAPPPQVPQVQMVETLLEI